MEYERRKMQDEREETGDRRQKLKFQDPNFQKAKRRETEDEMVVDSRDERRELEDENRIQKT